MFATKDLSNWILTLLKGTLLIIKVLEFQRTKMEMADGRANLKGKRR